MHDDELNRILETISREEHQPTAALVAATKARAHRQGLLRAAFLISLISGWVIGIGIIALLVWSDLSIGYKFAIGSGAFGLAAALNLMVVAARHPLATFFQRFEQQIG